MEQSQTQTLAHNVAAYRQLRGMSQRGLARAAQTTQVTVNNIENANANPRFSTLIRIAGALGVDVMQLLGPRIESTETKTQKAKTA
jgi:transcriptional regulator with XRE-family HTH domain